MNARELVGKMNREETVQLLMVIQSAFPNYKVPDKTTAVNTWFTMLHDYEYQLVMLSLQKYIATDTSGFAPSIGAIVQGIPKPQLDELNEMEAWSLVSKALRDSTYHSKERFAELPESVQKAVGTADNLRNWASTDVQSIENVVQSNFIKTYRTELKRKEETACLPDSIKLALEQAQRLQGENQNVKGLEQRRN